MKRYYDLSASEKLALTDADFQTAVKLEAVERGIKLPVTLDNIIKQHGFNGYAIPADSVFFYEIVAPGEYGHERRTGLAFKTIEEARAALAGAVAIYEDGYGANKQPKLAPNGELTVREVALSLSKPKWFATRVAELEEDNTEFEKLCEECVNDISNLRQIEYDKEVLSRKRTSYLELAKGDVEIAKAFWAKTERTEFPTE